MKSLTARSYVGQENKLYYTHKVLYYVADTHVVYIYFRSFLILSEEVILNFTLFYA